MKRAIAIVAAAGLAVVVFGARATELAAIRSTAGWAFLLGTLLGIGLGAGWARAERGWADWRGAVDLMRSRRRALPRLFGTLLGWAAVAVILAALAALVASGRH